MENAETLKAGDRIALFSYGSGAVSEFFSVELVEGYEKYLDKDRIKVLDKRKALSVQEYEKSSMRRYTLMIQVLLNSRTMKTRNMLWLKF